MPAPGIFDGELIAFDAQARPDFAALTDRMLATHDLSPRRRREHRTSVVRSG
jgi:ATP-dependent DNA ligase